MGAKPCLLAVMRTVPPALPGTGTFTLPVAPETIVEAFASPMRHATTAPDSGRRLVASTARSSIPSALVSPPTMAKANPSNQWFPVMHVWLQEQGSVRAAMDVPPKFQQGK